MTARIILVKSDEDFKMVDKTDRECGLITRSGDRSELIKVAHILDETHYEYLITTMDRLLKSGVDFKGKGEAEKKSIIKKPEKKPRRYEMVFYNE